MKSVTKHTRAEVIGGTGRNPKLVDGYDLRTRFAITTQVTGNFLAKRAGHVS